MLPSSPERAALATAASRLPSRLKSAVAMNRRLSEVAAYIPLYYQMEVLAGKKRLSGPIGPGLNQAGVTWNIYEWEWRR